MIEKSQRDEPWFPVAASTCIYIHIMCLLKGHNYAYHSTTKALAHMNSSPHQQVLSPRAWALHPIAADKTYRRQYPKMLPLPTIILTAPNIETLHRSSWVRKLHCLSSNYKLKQNPVTTVAEQHGSFQRSGGHTIDLQW